MLYSRASVAPIRFAVKSTDRADAGVVAGIPSGVEGMKEMNVL
jgi:hypothetical protein